MPGPTTTRDRLLESARVELTSCGHAGVSLRAVARRAGVSHAAPQNHFGDRAGLLTAVATTELRADDVAIVRDGVLVPLDHPEPPAAVAAGVAAAFTRLVTAGAPR